MIGTFHFASATSTEDTALKAIPSVIAEIRKQISGDKPDFLMLFASPHFAENMHEIVRSVRDELGPRTMIGCTGEGVIGSREEIERRSAISLVAAKMPGVELTTAILRGASLRESLSDNAPILQDTDFPEATKLFVMLADPFTTPMDYVLDAFNEKYPEVPIIGGMASGALVPGKNVLVVGDTVVRDGTAVVAFSGNLGVDVIVSQGCRPVGPILEVTEAQDNVIRELEGSTPFDHLQDLVSELSDDERRLLQNGLFVGRAIDSSKDALGRGDFLIRGVMGLDRESGALTVGDFIGEGELVQFHLRDAATAKEDLEMMLTPQTLFGTPSGAFLFSCNGRGTRLYDHANGDVSSIQEFFPGINLAGFFCAGEIGPIGGKNFLHGHTASLALIRPVTSSSGPRREARDGLST
jgi:small ligand-binding sensory domain FIST